MEIWKSVVGYEGSYEVSNLGNVKGIKRIVLRSDNSPITVYEKILSPYKTNKGYLVVCLSLQGKTKLVPIHRMVGKAFLDGDTSLQINHKDGNKENNVISNLEWVTCKENIKHASDTGLRKPVKGLDHKSNKGILNVYKDGILLYTICGNIQMREKGFTPSAVCRLLKRGYGTHKGCTFERVL